MNEDRFNVAYYAALQHEEEQDYDLAIDLFQKTEDYEDSKDHLKICMDAFCRQLIEKAGIHSEATDAAQERERNAERLIEKAEKELVQIRQARKTDEDRCWKIKREIRELTEDLSYLKGWFNWSKRQVIESKIDVLKQESEELQKKMDEKTKNIEKIIGIRKEAGKEREIARKDREAAFDEIRYGESEKWTDEVILEKAKARAKAHREKYRGVGNIVTFGHYSQTEDGEDDTPIEWVVIAREGEKSLLLSRYGLDATPYNRDNIPITWENCTLRIWLNVSFSEKAFSFNEQSAMMITSIDNSRSHGYWSTDGGNDTKDILFLLSYAEANKYLGVTYDNSSNIESRAAPTAYAINSDAYTSERDTTSDGSAAGRWLLRSPGDDPISVACVDTDGSLGCIYVHDNSGVIRPAFWLNLESDIF